MLVGILQAQENTTVSAKTTIDREMAKEEFRLSAEWKKYQLSWTMKDVNDRLLVRFYPIGDVGTLWIDAVQVEVGSEATEYEDEGW
ncbi:MAG TPA: hypothetical protein DCZ94_13720 [Lentisphaeria bacterium]|nr:MAG: hypothetical protein A2X48_11295 [Lentisphaerae bacterium GWF2_49_21]HBC88004.1 hypothetical protein [Lentisphaeria bacterium]